MTKKARIPRLIRSAQELRTCFSSLNTTLFETAKFKSPAAFYKIIDEEQTCSYRKVNSGCNRSHQKGFVIETTDGHFLTIGNCCALKKLGLEHKEIGSELAVFQKSIEEQQLSEDYATLFLKKDKILQSTMNSRQAVRSLKDSISIYLEDIPNVIAKALQDRAKTGSAEVAYEIMFEKTETGTSADKTFKGYNERQWRRFEVGKLNGVACLNQFRLTDIGSALVRIYKLWDSIGSDGYKRGLNKLVSDLSNSLTELQTLQEDLKKYCVDKDKFMSNEVQVQLLFLVNNRQKSEEMAQYLKRKGQLPDELVKTSNIIGAIESDLVKRHKGDGFRVAA